MNEQLADVGFWESMAQLIEAHPLGVVVLILLVILAYALRVIRKRDERNNELVDRMLDHSEMPGRRDE